jgi:hypothetical protein
MHVACAGRKITNVSSSAAVQVVNMAGSSQGARVGLRGLGAHCLLPAARRTVITGPGPLAENSFNDPLQVVRPVMTSSPD